MVSCFSHVWLMWPWLLCPWESPGKNTGVGCRALLQGSFQPRNWTRVSCITGRFFTAKPSWKPENLEVALIRNGGRKRQEGRGRSKSWRWLWLEHWYQNTRKYKAKIRIAENKEANKWDHVHFHICILMNTTWNHPSIVLTKGSAPGLAMGWWHHRSDLK